MPDLAIGDRMELSSDQLAVITGVPSGTLEEGKVFTWRKGRFQVAESTPHACVIVRLAANDRGAETAVQQPQTHDPMDAFNRPTAPAGSGSQVGHLDARPVMHPVDADSFGAPRGYPGTDPGREIVDSPAGGLAGPPSGPSIDVEKKRLYQDHPHIMRSPQNPGKGTGLPGGEPVDQSLEYAGRTDPRAMLARMFLIPRAPSGTLRSPR
jgi:hypothetical protein